MVKDLSLPGLLILALSLLTRHNVSRRVMLQAAFYELVMNRDTCL
jgi:hypothetical protein